METNKISENNSFIKIHRLYINNNNELDKKYVSKVSLLNNCLPKNDLINILTDAKIYENKHYKLLNILTYNVDIDKDKLKSYVDFLNGTNDLSLDNNNELINSNNENKNEFNFLKNLPLNDLLFTNSISNLKTLNGIYLIYYEKYNDTSKSNTRKINKFKNHKSKRNKSS